MADLSAAHGPDAAQTLIARLRQESNVAVVQPAGDPITQPLAFMLAVGVLLDAFVVRLTLVPAVMALIGNRMWYHPRWFARVVPDLDIEGAELEHRRRAEQEWSTVD
ncbi:MMPL family transporter [Nocardia gamkensis]|uniref:MMPL family transporter n=1 Tax=Nocardia gamkensis TaxID=352869 RepID=UPI0037C6866F